MKLLDDPYEVDMPQEDLARALWTGGYLDVGTLKEALALSRRLLTKAVKHYQEFNGLTVDGEVGPVTVRSMQAERFCGFPDIMQVTAEITTPRWPQNQLTWGLTNQWRGLPLPVVKEAFSWAFHQWELVCDIHFEYVDDAPHANIKIQSGVIDRSGSVLAQSELANGSMSAKNQKYDSSESWVFDAQPPRFTIDLGRVAAHEIGHVIGIPHISAGNLLQPMYDTRIRTPQAGDIRQAVERYGEPTTPPGPPDDRQFLVTISGTGAITGIEATGFRVTPLV